MPRFSKKEIQVLLIIGAVSLAMGLLMAIIGQSGISREFGVPEYMVSLRNAGITLSLLAVLWSGLALYHQPAAR